jgi:Lipopolysaccharide-assembly
MRIPLSVVMRSLLPLCTLLLLGLASGCAHYQLGTEGKLAFRTLYIAPVENKAKLPQAVAIITNQLREAFIHDGRVTVVDSPADADATLTVSLSTYGRGVATSRPDDTGLARKFNLDLVAHCTLRDNRTSTVLFERRPVSAQQQIFATATPSDADSVQQQAEYQALPLLATSLAQKVAHATLDVW